ncbi:MAG: ribose-phosphate pyrophosphokinase-like domain-containing protein [Patescibacteria group bacterium]|nr:ribose-phosphate pyrophosphokinase-like domain-containing protein [Patescibacteria group bacterium]
MKEIQGDFMFFCGRNNRPLGDSVWSYLGEYLGSRISPDFIDFGEWRDSCPNNKIPKFSAVKGKSVVLFDSIVSEKAMMEFITLVMAFKKQYLAHRVIAVLPFLLTRRCDHEEPEYNYEINYLGFYLELLKFAGVDDLIVCTPHSEAMGKKCEDLGIRFHPAYMDFSRAIKTIIPKEEKIVFYSPDQGSISRAVFHAKHFSGSLVLFNLKERKLNNQTEIVSADKEKVSSIVTNCQQEFDYKGIDYFSEEEILGAHVVIIEDEMSSGGTANQTAKKLKSAGAKAIYFAFTHPVCVNGWKYTLFDQEPFARVLAGNTIIRDQSNRTWGKVLDVSTAETIASILYKVLTPGH